MKKHLVTLTALTLTGSASLATSTIINDRSNTIKIDNDIKKVPKEIEKATVEIIGILFGDYQWENKDKLFKPGDSVSRYIYIFETVLKEAMPKIVQKYEMLKIIAPYIEETMAMFHIEIAKDAPQVLNKGTTVVKVTYVIDTFTSVGKVTFLGV